MRFSRQISPLRSLFAALVFTTLFLSSGLAAADALTPEDVAKLRAVGSVVVSPDGAYAAYTLYVPRAPFHDENGSSYTELHLLSLKDGSDHAFVTGEVKVGGVQWTPDGTAICYTAKRHGEEHSSLYMIPVAGGESRKLLENETGIGSYAFNPTGTRLAFTAKEPKDKELEELAEKGFNAEVYEEGLRFTRLYTVDIDLMRGSAGEPRILPLEGNVSYLRYSPIDERIACALAPTPLVDDEYMKRRIHVIDADTGDVLARIENPGKLGGLAWSPDGQNLAIKSAHDIHDPSPGRLMVVPASGGEMRDLLPELFDTGAVSSYGWKDATTLMYVAAKGVWNEVGQVSLEGKIKVVVETGGPILDRIQLSKDGRTVVFVGDAPSYPGEVFVMDRQRKKPTRMTDSNPWLAEKDFGLQEVVRYTARDGMEIEGILIHPVNEQLGQRYPLVLYVHGGPESHHRNGFQLRYSNPGHVFAARGGAVFYTNYRGSTGYGVPFSKADHGDFAGAEFDDLVDAVDHLIGTGLVDETKVGVTGGSYGGYATAWLTTRYTDRFAAGVMFVGISNNISKFGTSDIPEEMFLVHQRVRTFDDWEMFLERSPIYYAGQAKTPLLIMHGKDDPRVNVGQSRELHRHIKTRTDTPVRLVLYPGEGHGNRKAAARFDYNLRMLRWFDHYLMGPGGEKPPFKLDYGHDEDATESQNADTQANTENPTRS